MAVRVNGEFGGRAVTRSRNARSMTGFTLIELMIAVGIVAILAAIAVPNYQDSVRKSRRGQAKADLVEAAQFAERYRTVNGTYNPLAIGDGENQIREYSPKKGTAYYTIALAAKSDTTFKLTATPIASGPQAKDRCGVLSIDQSGVKKHSKGTDDECQFGETGT